MNNLVLDLFSGTGSATHTPGSRGCTTGTPLKG